MMRVLLLLISLFFISCRSDINTKNIDFLNSVYRPVLDDEFLKKTKDIQEDLKRVSFSANEMKMSDFASWFADRFNMGLIYNDDLSGKTINAELRDANKYEICNAVARYFNTDITDLGTTFFIGEQKLSDSAVLVRKVRGVKVEDLKGILNSLQSRGSQSSQGHVTSDGVIWMFNTVEALQPFNTAFDQLENIDRDAWVVQLYLFDFNKSKAKAIGLDVTGAGNIAVRMLADNSTPSFEFNSNAVLNGLINISDESDTVSIVAQPLFVVSDGFPAKSSNTLSIPYITKITTENGFIEDSGLNFIESGLDINVQIRELSKGSILSLDLTNSKVIQLLDNGLPVRNIANITSETPLATSGVYLLAQSDYIEKKLGDQTIGYEDSYLESSVQVYARVYKLDRKFRGLSASK